MAVELPPTGTRGQQLPKLPRPLMNAMTGLSVAFFRLLGNRVRVMGADLLLLTTVGAKTGKTRRTVLGWFPDRDNAWLVLASYAGASRYVNMARTRIRCGLR
jgi:hypothetical protein